MPTYIDMYCSSCFLFRKFATFHILSHRIYVWYICLHLPLKNKQMWLNIPYMDPMGMCLYIYEFVGTTNPSPLFLYIFVARRMPYMPGEQLMRSAALGTKVGSSFVGRKRWKIRFHTKMGLRDDHYKVRVIYIYI